MRAACALQPSSKARWRLSGDFGGKKCRDPYLDEETQETHGIDVANEELVVVIDPIDGTTNYYEASLEEGEEKRNTNWAISVGFVKNGELRAGVVSQPQTGKIYYAEKGEGAYLNGKRLRVSHTLAPQGAKLIYSPPYPKDKEAYATSETAIARIGNEIPMRVTTLGSQVIGPVLRKMPANCKVDKCGTVSGRIRIAAKINQSVTMIGDSEPASGIQ
jgi:hypothetical protein